MAKISILQTIKHDGQQFIKDEVRIVDDKLAGYFCGNGWAKDVTGEIPTSDVPPTDVKLEVQNGQHGTKASQLGVNENG